MKCSHGMPNPKTCLDCMEEGGLPPAQWKFLNFMKAKFPGVCRRCGGEFTTGDDIKRWDKEDQDTAYTHLGCGLN